jgi:hemolysin-activating ACP:hemolysin acyltransferase
MIAARVAESLKREEEVMKHVDGWKVGEKIYSSRWAAPTGGH